MKPVQSATVTNVLLIVSFILFTFGMFSPLMTVKKWVIFENTFSLLAGLMQFFHAGQYALFVIVAVFSLEQFQYLTEQVVKCHGGLPRM